MHIYLIKQDGYFNLFEKEIQTDIKFCPYMWFCINLIFKELK